MNHDKRIALAVLFLAVSPLASADQVRLVTGRSESGEVVAVSRDGVQVEKNGTKRAVPVVNIKQVVFAGDPPQLMQARINVANGGYLTALERLEGVSAASLESDLAKQDLEFLTAYARARLALEGEGDAGRAYKALEAFVRAHGDSYHYYEAVETLGDLLRMAGRFDRAEKLYAVVAKGRFPVLRARGRVLAGEVSLAKGEHEEAIGRFEAALAVQSDDPLLRLEHNAARLGKAESLAATDRLPEALVEIAAVTGSLDPGDDARQAAAYNTLGRCYEAAGDDRGALLAYLHTDLVFDDDRSTHAEALARLATLWPAAGEPGEGRDALDRLRRRYGRTRWAREAGETLN